MIEITLRDNKKVTYAKPISALQLANDISKSLVKEALVILLDGEFRDLSYIISDSCKIEFILRSDEKALGILRHDCAHVLAQAVQSLYPNLQITFGPATSEGFYYDFYGDYQLSTSDFAKIEKKMKSIIANNLPFEREVWQHDKAINYFTSIGETFKAEHVSRIAKDQELSIYRQGDWLDLCKGPHAASTKYIGAAFKLTKVAGSYWLGDANNQPLQRIYGTVFRDQPELDLYLEQQRLAKERDHRKLGVEMKLFHLQEEASGSIFWHERGWELYRKIEDYIRYRLRDDGYFEVNTPYIVDKSLWQKSGHWDKFGDDIFILDDHSSITKNVTSIKTTNSEISSKVQASLATSDKIINSEKIISSDAVSNKRTFALKPMNCPCHVQIYKHDVVSYKDLPIRMSEFGACSRNEPSGALFGIMRLRAFKQDDAHIFCQENQIVSETIRFCKLLKTVYKDFGFNNYKVKFSTRPDVSAGSDEVWQAAEEALTIASKQAKLDYEINPKEGAFYGPKLEFVLKDALNRDWQCGTWQVDFVLPDRLEANYINAKGEKKVPVMLHRAVLGSLERFIGILIENFAGHLPIWLSPSPVAIISLTDLQNDKIRQISKQLHSHNIPHILDTTSQRMQYKIRKYSKEKIPQIWIVGKNEELADQVSIRTLGSKHNTVLAISEAINKLVEGRLFPI